MVGGLLKGKARALDMGGMVRFEKEGAGAHQVDPCVGEAGRVQEAAGALDVGESGCDCVGDGEAGGEGHGWNGLRVRSVADAILPAPLPETGRQTAVVRDENHAMQASASQETLP